MENPSKSIIEKFRVAGWLDTAAILEKAEGSGKAELNFKSAAVDKLVTLADVFLELERDDARLSEQELKKLKDIAYVVLKARLERKISDDDPEKNPRL